MKICGNAPSAASQQGHTENFLLLLVKGADINALRGNCDDALVGAAVAVPRMHPEQPQP